MDWLGRGVAWDPLVGRLVHCDGLAERKEEIEMKSANEVSDLINSMKAEGLPLQEQAWKTGLACVGWAYVFGAYGEYCDPSNRRSRARDDHPTIKSKCKNFNGKDEVTAGCVNCQWYLGTDGSDESRHEGRTRFFDCRGYTRWILKQVYGFDLKGAGATSQWNTASNWSSSGEIGTMPKDTLCCLFVRKGNVMEHTGFGLNNETLECSSGVQHFTTRNKKWTHWAIPKCVGSAEGGDDGKPEIRPTLRRGDKGSYVTLAQTALYNKGYDLGSYGVDGDFGKATEEAVKRFQRDAGLTSDGVIGPKTWEALDKQEAVSILYTVNIPNQTYYQAEALVKQYAGASMIEERR